MTVYEPQKFRRKDPGVIEAILFDGTQASAQAITDWLHDNGRPNVEAEWITGVSGTGSAAMPSRAPRLTLNGVWKANPGDYVVVSGDAGGNLVLTGDHLHGLYEAVPDLEPIIAAGVAWAASEEDRISGLDRELEDQGDGQGGDSDPGELPGDEEVDDPEDDGDESEDQGESVHGDSLPQDGEVRANGVSDYPLPDPDPFNSEMPAADAPAGVSFSDPTPTLEDVERQRRSVTPPDPTGSRDG